MIAQGLRDIHFSCGFDVVASHGSTTRYNDRVVLADQVFQEAHVRFNERVRIFKRKGEPAKFDHDFQELCLDCYYLLGVI
jgi:hypothetical protein